jgi:hypothetical protein
MEKRPELIVPGRRLGKLPPKLDRRTLKLARYLVVEKAPPKADYITGKVPQFPMLLNSDYGNCTICGPLHMRQVWNANTSRDFAPTDQMALEGYQAACGYVPGRPETDQGGNMLDVLRFWRTVGIGGETILAYAKVDVTDRNEVKLAIAIFGAIYTGAMLPLSAQGQGIWHMTGGPRAKVGSWGGHAYMIPKYERYHVHNVTWDEVIPATYRWNDTYCDEAYVVFSREWVTGEGRSPTGIDLTNFVKDLSRVTGNPVYAMAGLLEGAAAGGMTA